MSQPLHQGRGQAQRELSLDLRADAQHVAKKILDHMEAQAPGNIELYQRIVYELGSLVMIEDVKNALNSCLLYTSPSPRDS